MSKTEQILLTELRQAYEGALEIIEQQRSQLALAFFALAEIGFDLNDWMDAIG